MTEQTTKMLGTADVAKLTGLSKAHVRRLLQEDTQLHGVKVNAWVWLVERAEVDRFVAERKKRRAR